MPSIDMFRALELLTTAVRQPGPQSLVGRALSLEQPGEKNLEELLSRHSVRELYTQGRLQVRLTLGALVVLDTARRSEERGLPSSEALEHATAAAARFLDLIPDSFFIKAIGEAAADDAASVSPGSAPSGRRR